MAGTGQSNYEMDGSKFRNTMHSLNYGNVMEAAARNYMKEAKAEEEANNRRVVTHYDLEDLEDVSWSPDVFPRSTAFGLHE